MKITLWPEKVLAENFKTYLNLQQKFSMISKTQNRYNCDVCKIKYISHDIIIE